VEGGWSRSATGEYGRGEGDGGREGEGDDGQQGTRQPDLRTEAADGRGAEAASYEEDEGHQAEGAAAGLDRDGVGDEGGHRRLPEPEGEHERQRRDHEHRAGDQGQAAPGQHEREGGPERRDELAADGT